MPDTVHNLVLYIALLYITYSLLLDHSSGEDEDSETLFKQIKAYFLNQIIYTIVVTLISQKLMIFVP